MGHFRAIFVFETAKAMFGKLNKAGKFPDDWKEAAVTPVLKKGSPDLLSNHRPVSCLPAASQVLEIIKVV